MITVGMLVMRGHQRVKLVPRNPTRGDCTICMGAYRNGAWTIITVSTNLNQRKHRFMTLLASLFTEEAVGSQRAIQLGHLRVVIQWVQKKVTVLASVWFGSHMNDYSSSTVIPNDGSKSCSS